MPRDDRPALIRTRERRHKGGSLRVRQVARSFCTNFIGPMATLNFCAFRQIRCLDAAFIGTRLASWVTPTW